MYRHEEGTLFLDYSDLGSLDALLSLGLEDSSWTHMLP